MLARLPGHVKRRFLHHRGTETQRHREGNSKNAPANALRENRGIKVDDKPYLLAGQTHISKQLRFVNSLDALNTLQLNDHRILDEQVDSVATVQMDALVHDRQINFSPVANASQVELMTEALFVGRFEKTRTECPMHFDGSANNR
jgi:hypothetical protein